MSQHVPRCYVCLNQEAELLSIPCASCQRGSIRVHQHCFVQQSLASGGAQLVLSESRETNETKATAQVRCHVCRRFTEIRLLLEPTTRRSAIIRNCLWFFSRLIDQHSPLLEHYSTRFLFTAFVAVVISLLLSLLLLNVTNATAAAAAAAAAATALLLIVQALVQAVFIATIARVIRPATPAHVCLTLFLPQVLLLLLCGGTSDQCGNSDIKLPFVCAPSALQRSVPLALLSLMTHVILIYVPKAFSVLIILLAPTIIDAVLYWQRTLYLRGENTQIFAASLGAQLYIHLFLLWGVIRGGSNRDTAPQEAIAVGVAGFFAAFLVRFGLYLFHLSVASFFIGVMLRMLSFGLLSMGIVELERRIMSTCMDALTLHVKAVEW